MHPAIQSAVAAQHIRDMLDHAAEDGRVREARRARTGRRWRRSPSRATAARAAAPRDASSRSAARSGPAPTQC